MAIRPRASTVLLPVLLSLAAPRAFAQPAAPPEAPVDAPKPKPITIDDPMLTPLPDAPKTLTSWRQAIALSSAEDADYSISLFEIERARGEERRVLAGTLPTLTGTGVVTLQIVRSEISTFDVSGAPITIDVPPSPTATASLTLRQPLLAPRVWYGIGTAEKNTEAAERSAEDVQRRLVGRVATAIVAVVTSERIAETNRVGLRAALERLALQKRRLELGSGTSLDVVRFEQDVVAARATLIQGDEDLRRTRESLGLALGTIEPYGVSRDISINEIESTIAKICKSDSLESRPDIRALVVQKEIAERSVTDADLLYSPTADVSSTLTYSSEDIIGTKNYSWNVQGVLTIPLWDGGARYGIRRSALATVRQQEERLDAAKRSAHIEITQAQRAVSVATNALAVAQRARDLAAETDRLAQRAFEAGSVTSFDLVDASRRLREAELSLAVRELELVRAKIAAVLATATCATQ
jgi:outer membrane protein TolC